MFGRNKPIDNTINTRIDHFAEMEQKIRAACSMAEDNGVSVAAIHAMFKGFTEQFRQRSLYVADVTRAKAQTPDEAVARAMHIKADRERRALEAERAEYREAVNRAAEAAEERQRGSR
jgi:hypothetical protein